MLFMVNLKPLLKLKLKTGKIIAGTLPPKALSMVKEWNKLYLNEIKLTKF